VNDRPPRLDAQQSCAFPENFDPTAAMPLKNPSVVCVCQYASLYPPLNCSGSESTSCRIRSPQTFDVRLVEVDCCAGHKGVVVTQSAPCHLLITLTNVRYIMCVWPGTMDSWTVDGLELCSEGIRNSCSSSSSWSYIQYDEQSASASYQRLQFTVEPQLDLQIHQSQQLVVTTIYDIKISFYTCCT